jgi:hypothetical protein
MVQRAYEEPEFNEVLERVPLEVRRSLTFEQRSALGVALRETRRKHTIDLRFPIPLIFTQLYFVLLVGKDLRRDTQDKMISRRTEAGHWGMAAVIGIFVLVLAVAGLAIAYFAKSKAGVDILPDAHAKDVLRGLGVK